jgi:hypothetical protein
MKLDIAFAVCPSNLELSQGFTILPHDCRARTLMGPAMIPQKALYATKIRIESFA